MNRQNDVAADSTVQSNPPSPPDPADPRLAEEVFLRFTHRLVALARSRLDPRLAAKVDAEDIVQSAYKSFFWRYEDEQFDLANWGSLWGLLVRITVRKCLRQQELYFADRRHVGREAQAARDAAGMDPLEVCYAREPEPAQAAVLLETLEQLMRGLDATQQEILSLRLQGYTIPEISVQTLRSERTVERVLERVRQRAQRLEMADTSET